LVAKYLTCLWLLLLMLAGNPAAEDEWEGLRAPVERNGRRVTRCRGMPVEEFGRTVADYFTGFRFHIFEYPEDVTLDALVLFYLASGDRKYLDYVANQFKYYLKYKRGAPPHRGEKGQLFLRPNREEYEALRICPWCSRSDISPWREKRYRPPFCWLEYRDGEPVVNVWAFYNLPGQRALTSLYMVAGDEAILELLDVPGQRKWAEEIVGTTWEEYRRFIIDGAPRAGTTARLGVITGDPVFFDAAARYILKFRKMLDPETGLFYQGWSYPVNKMGTTPVVWGRGSGWWAWGAAVTLSHLPRSHPRWREIHDLFLRNMAALKRWQDTAGLWHQSVDHWDSWPETSGTGLIVSAMARGVRLGFLPEEYRDVALKGLEGLKGYVDSDGIVRHCCVGTGAQDTAHDYYARPMPPQDPHAPGPVIGAAAEVMLMEKGSGKCIP